MNRVVRLATVGLCAAVALLNSSPAQGQPDLKRWYFAEGSTNAGFGFEQEILIANPTGTPANVTLRFLPQDGSPPIVGNALVQPYSRSGVNARQFVGSALGVALEVTSDVDIVVERSMYWGGGLFNFGPGYNPGPVIDMRAGHNVLGVNAPAVRWSFAEGAAGSAFGFQTYVLVSNPSLTDAASVQVRYLTSNGEQVVDAASGVLAPGQRRTFFANGALEATLGARPQFDFAIDVQSQNSVPIVAERAMYWGPNLSGGHAAMGVQPQSVWYFAEGVQGVAPINFDTYILLYNPSETEAIDVEVDFYGPSGLARNVVKTLAPLTRANVYAGEYPNELAGADKAFSVRALNTLGKPFVAERAVYWRGLREGSAAAGTSVGARKWGFADGQEGGFAQFRSPADPDPRHFSTYYLILNNTDVPVNVRGVFYLEANGEVPAGSGAETTVFVPARSRATITPASFPGLHNRKFAAFFEADGEVIVERASYWGAGINGGHGSAGAILPDALPTLPAPAAPPAPMLTGITPTRGNPAGGTPVIISGTGFGLGGGNTTVAFGATEVPQSSITVLDANTISVVTPASGRGVAGLIVRTRGVELFNPNVTFEFVDPFAAGPGHSFGNLEGVVGEVAARRPFDLVFSCTEHGSPNSNTFMFEVVAELRRRFQSNRWGLNWKRGNVGDLSQDIVNYYSGPEGGNMRNSTQVRIYDIIGGHCGGRPSPFWADQTGPTRAAGTVGRWTTDPMCRIPRYRDAQFANGEWMFPECR